MWLEKKGSNTKMEGLALDGKNTPAIAPGGKEERVFPTKVEWFISENLKEILISLFSILSVK